MISTLNGVVSEKSVDQIILEVGGVGYGLLVTSEDHGRLSAGSPVKVYVYEHVRENSYDLYGFVSMTAKKLFEQLMSVNGVGPKMALSILSVGNLELVRQAIAGGDVKLIQKASGVGKRVAERVVVDLKDKVGLIGVDLASTGILQSEAGLLEDEAIEALVALGYSPQDASAALKNVDKSLSTEDRIKQALKLRS